MYKFLGWTFSMGTFFGKFEMQSRLIILQSNDYANSRCLFYSFSPSITDGVHRNENFEEIIPVFSSFSNFFKQNKKKYIKAILCNFSMRFLKYF